MNTSTRPTADDWKAAAALALLIVVLSLLFIGCGQSSTAPSPQPPSTPAAQPPTPACSTVHHDAACSLAGSPLHLVCTPEYDEQVCK